MFLSLAILFGVLGPVDAWVLRRMSRRGMTLTTTTGWIGLAATGALLLAARKPPPFTRCVRLVDQAGGFVVGTSEVLAARGTAATSSDASVWWEPAGGPAGPAERDAVTDAYFHQDRQGNRPDGRREDENATQVLRGRSTLARPPVVDADLHWATGAGGRRLAGTVTNRGPVSLNDVRLAVGGRYVAVATTLAPGGVAGVGGAGTAESSPPEVPDLAPERNTAFDRAASRDGAVVLYARFDEARAATKVDGYLRALLEVPTHP